MKAVGTVKTQRNRKIVCEDGCGFLAYCSRKVICKGIATCPCGGRLIPEDPDDAALVLSEDELEQHPMVELYRRELASVMHGQAPHAQKWGGDHLRSPDELAARKVEKARREAARRNQLAGLLVGAITRETITDDMPF